MYLTAAVLPSAVTRSERGDPPAFSAQQAIAQRGERSGVRAGPGSASIDQPQHRPLVGDRAEGALPVRQRLHRASAVGARRREQFAHVAHALELQPQRVDCAVGAVRNHAACGAFQLPAGGLVPAQRGCKCARRHARRRRRIIRRTRAVAQAAHGMAQLLAIQRFQPVCEAPYQRWQAFLRSVRYRPGGARSISDRVQSGAADLHVAYVSGGVKSGLELLAERMAKCCRGQELLERQQSPGGDAEAVHTSTRGRITPHRRCSLAPFSPDGACRGRERGAGCRAGAHPRNAAFHDHSSGAHMAATTRARPADTRSP